MKNEEEDNRRQQDRLKVGRDPGSENGSSSRRRPKSTFDDLDLDLTRPGAQTCRSLTERRHQDDGEL